VRLRTLSYNIHKCIGGIDRRYAPDRIVEVIHKLDVDVAMLQEVDGGVARSNHDHQVDLLAEQLGLRYRTWFPNVDVRGGGQYGNAILSRYPIIESTNLDLTIRFKKRRSALHAVLRIRHDDVDRTVHVYNMHLGLARYERRRQLRMFLDSHPFQNLHHDTPIVVGGDLNDVYGGLGELLAPAGFRGIERRPLTFPAWGPMRALDAIFVRGAMDFVRLARCDSELARRASDHRPLVAEVRLRPQTHHHADLHHKPPAPRP
jgi:endonuclease/exonuclease/phosphatase family metal-dependent hydrolase